MEQPTNQRFNQPTIVRTNKKTIKSIQQINPTVTTNLITYLLTTVTNYIPTVLTFFRGSIWSRHYESLIPTNHPLPKAC